MAGREETGGGRPGLAGGGVSPRQPWGGRKSLAALRRPAGLGVMARGREKMKVTRATAKTMKRNILDVTLNMF